MSKPKVKGKQAQARSVATKGGPRMERGKGTAKAPKKPPGKGGNPFRGVETGLGESATKAYLQGGLFKHGKP